MTINRTAVITNIILFVITGLPLAMLGGGAGIGAAACITGVIDLVVAGILWLARNNKAAKDYLLLGGIVLLIGFSFCSIAVFSVG